MFAAKRRRKLKVPLATLFDVPTATTNVLLYEGYNHLDELEGFAAQTLLRMKGVGLVGVEQINQELKKNGLQELRWRKKK